MALKEEAPSAAEPHFEEESLEVLLSFPDEVKRALGISLLQLQIGREPTSQTRSTSFIGSGVYELKSADERVVAGDPPIESGGHYLRVALF
jgi:phage-related protein